MSPTDSDLEYLKGLWEPRRGLNRPRRVGDSQPDDASGSGLVNLICSNATDDSTPYKIITGSPSGEIVTTTHYHPKRPKLAPLKINPRSGCRGK